jgi:Protein of unknown function (DUF3788)
MAGSAFPEKDQQPDEQALAAALGETRAHWDALVAHLGEQAGAGSSEWKHYGKKYGWQLKFSVKRRALIYLVPHEGNFLAGLALNPKAVAALDDTDLPPEFVEGVKAEKACHEGRPARVVVTGPAEIAMVKTLIGLKLGST